MSNERIVERSKLGRMIGLAPKVYRCHGLDGVWHREHEAPHWVVGYGPSALVPCCRCSKLVIPRTFRSSS